MYAPPPFWLLFSCRALHYIAMDEDVPDDQDRCDDRRSDKVAVDGFEHLFPVVSEVVAEEQKGAHPDARAGISEEREIDDVTQTGRSGNNRREMPHPRDVVADEQRPVAHVIEPVVHLCLFGFP